jgi:hypothetical protein
VKPDLIIVAAVACLLSAPVAQAWSPSADQARGMGAGKPISEVTPAADGAGLIHAAIEIPATPQVVWMVMNDCRLIRKLITSAMDCKVLRGDAEHSGWDVRETVTKGNFFIPTIHNIYRSDYKPFNLIRFKKAGGDLRVEEGEWRLEALNGGAGTRVIYTNLVAVSIMAPAPLVREGMRKDTAKVLVNLRRESMQLARQGT